MKKDKDIIQLPKEVKSKCANKLQEYIETEFDTEIGNLQAEIFLDYITKHVGVYYYNEGVADSLSVMKEKADDLYLIMKDDFCDTK